MADFWNHIVVLFSHYDNPDYSRRDKITKQFNEKLLEVAKEINQKNSNFAIPENFPIYFVGLHNPNQETKDSFNDIITKFKDMNPMFKKIEVSELPKLFLKRREMSRPTLILNLN